MNSGSLPLTLCPFCRTRGQQPGKKCRHCNAIIPMAVLPLHPLINVRTTVPLPQRQKGDTLMERIEQLGKGEKNSPIESLHEIDGENTYMSTNLRGGGPGAAPAQPGFQETLATAVPQLSRDGTGQICGILVSFDLDPTGIIFPVRDGRNSLGSNPKSSIHLEDRHISKSHASIVYDLGRFLLIDNISTNGTYLNNKLVKDPIELSDGDIIRLGLSSLMFRDLRMAGSSKFINKDHK